MSAADLFFYILLAVLAQVVVFSALALLRRGMSALLRLGKPADGPEQAGWSGFREFRVVRRCIETPDESIRSFYLKPADGGPLPSYKPGQYLTFRLPVTDPATGEGKEIVRCYSLSDSPGKDGYRVSIKRVPPPGLSSNHFHDALREGDSVFVKPPGGHFFLKDGNGPVVLIAGGIGITPLLSMLNGALEENGAREVWLFYGVRNGADHAMKDHLATLARTHPGFRLQVCYSAPGAEDRKGRDYHHAGRIDVALLRQVLSFRVYDFYLCGPRGMLESMVPALRDWGIAEDNIHYEAFGPASLGKTGGAEPDAAPVSVTFSKSNKTLTWDGTAETLLDFAEDNGIHIDSGCRAGGCGSCQTAVIEGGVDYLQEPEFDAEGGACLPCVSRPKQDLVLEA